MKKSTKDIEYAWHFVKRKKQKSFYMYNMEKITIFIIETGEPSFQQCLHQVKNQTYKNIEIKIISHTYPMWKAFQRMLDECDTKYFVQVDADMLLYPKAIESLYTQITKNPTKNAISVGWLWDNDVERQITGVKIYNHQICVHFPYKDSISCEMTQVKDMEKHGYAIDVMNMPNNKESCFGIHYPCQTPEMAFRRWERNMIKMRKLEWMTWLAKYPSQFYEQLAKDPNNQILKAKVFGAMSGLSQANIDDNEANYNMENQSYRRYSALLGDNSIGPKEMTLYLTDKCNFKCVFDGNPCMRESEIGTPESGNISIEMLEQILDRFPSIKGCCIAGYGEPLLHPKLKDLIDILKKKKVFVGIITNGALILQKMDTLKHDNISYVSISLNAHTRESHENYSKTKTWDKVLNGIKALKQESVNVGISCVITRQNIETIPNYLELANELDVNFINFLNVLPHGNPNDLNFLSSVITEDCIKEKAMIEIYKNHPFAHRVKTWIKPISNKNPYKCQSPLVSIGVDAEGSVSFCRRIDPPEKKNGSFMENDIWFSKSRVNLLMNVVGDQKNHKTCQGCFGNWQG